MNWEFIAKYLPMYEKAALLTVKIGVIGILFAILLGLVCAAIQYYKVPVLRWIVAVYVELSRNTPLLVQLFFIYYGFPKIGIRMPAELCGVVGLAFLGGSYMAESFRSGLEAVEPIQSESATSLGMSSGQVLRYVILPQAMSTSIPAFVANIIFLLKETSVFSAISLMDLMFTAKDLIGLYYKTTESLFLLVVFYLLILLPVSIVGSLVERRMRYREGYLPDLSGIYPDHAAVGAFVYRIFRVYQSTGLEPVRRGGIRYCLRPVGYRRDGRSGARSPDQYSEASVRKQ